MGKNKNEGINVFQKYLSLWVLFCMIVGVLIGKYIPIIPIYFRQNANFRYICADSNINLDYDLSNDDESRFSKY